ncbi:hypothetical protein JZ751_022644 [Albula glossodonta]|uniref:DUF4211 domain-containing protein n=1 Tax=Albula glossodonta TaxID=121402 RepID=A0A8T2PFT5_9TELE|nr:hypothetical protein JZ751_022644 [Albula glossodonta]
MYLAATMSIVGSSRTYATRRRSRADASRRSRVNWRKTRVSVASYLDDSEESEASTPSTTSESEYEDESEEDGPLEIIEDRTPTVDGSDAEEKCAVTRSRRKRSASNAIFTVSSSDTDSDVGSHPVRKVLPKKRQNLQLSDSEPEAAAKEEAEKKAIEAKEAAEKRKERRKKLLELSKRRRSRKSTFRRRTLEESDEAEGQSNDHDDDNEEEEEEDSPCQLLHSSEEEQEDKDSLNDFIVESDNETGEDGSSVKGAEGSILSHHLPQCEPFVTGSLLKHFQVVVKALLINALDDTFLKSLYDGERTKRYALEMKDSLYHLDQRSILPRLENLKQRSRWSDRYKERVECYPKVRVFETGVRGTSCQACELHRHCRFTVRLSGQLYDNKTLRHDEFMPDDTQAFQVGTVCASRTEVYHQLKHFKYHLFCRCQTVLKEEEKARGEDGEEPVKDTVSRVLVKLQEDGWITEQYEAFQGYLNDADFFQEEKLD